MSPPGELLTKIETTLWGAYGTNGLNGDVKRHGREIADLYGRDETLREDMNTRIANVTDRVDAKLDGLYKLIATLIVSILVSSGGIIATLIVTAK